MSETVIINNCKASALNDLVVVAGGIMQLSEMTGIPNSRITLLLSNEPKMTLKDLNALVSKLRHLDDTLALLPELLSGWRCFYGLKLRQALRKNRHDYSTATNLLGISKAHLSNIMAGRSIPSEELLSLIGEHYGDLTGAANLMGMYKIDPNIDAKIVSDQGLIRLIIGSTKLSIKAFGNIVDLSPGTVSNLAGGKTAVNSFSAGHIIDSLRGQGLGSRWLDILADRYAMVDHNLLTLAMSVVDSPVKGLAMVGVSRPQISMLSRGLINLRSPETNITIRKWIDESLTDNSRNNCRDSLGRISEVLSYRNNRGLLSDSDLVLAKEHLSELIKLFD